MKVDDDVMMCPLEGLVRSLVRACVALHVGMVALPVSLTVWEALRIAL